MKISDIGEQKSKIFTCMNNIYNAFHNVIFNNEKNQIIKDEKHFSPVLWTYLFNGNENINFIKILSDIYAHELYQVYLNSV